MKNRENHERRENREKIILMAKLASYDKYNAPRDRKKAEYFRHDYVYRQNMVSRLCTLAGSLIVVLFYFMHRIVIHGIDVLDIDVLALDLVRVAIFIVLMQLVYSIIGFLLHTKEYNDAGERIERYMENMEELNKRKEYDDD